MMEKIMKAVKSGNKKRGRNITVGAVVGMLLSCTVVMGAGTDVTGLEIINNGSKIEFIDKDGKKFEPGAENDPYPENTWNEETKLYINNSKISGESTDGNGCGLKINEDGVNIVSNGMIIVTTEKVGGTIYGIDVYGNGVNIENNGKIIAIYKAQGVSSYGIGIDEDMNNIINSGLINAVADDKGDSYGIATFASVNDITNRGVINSSSAGSTSYGISIGADTESIENSGVIYGDKYAIHNSNSIDNAYNYELLVSSTDETVSSVTLTKNLGLIFKDDSGTYKAEDDDFKIFGTTTTDAEVTVGYDEKYNPIKEKYTIINAKAKNDDRDDIEGTESLTLKNGKLYFDADNITGSEISDFSSDKKYILNGIENTLKISGRKNELNNSVVNAYKTAVVMDQGMSMLTLDNTVVNGGIAEDSTAISITKDGSTLTLKGDSIINSTNTAIMITGNNNAVTLEGNAIVNGKMESKGNNILNLYGKADGSMNMFYDISGFTDISIDNNVTFFEDMKVTGTKEVTVEKSGVLSLRLKKDGDLSPAAIVSSTSIPIATHAFSGTDRMTIEGISPEESGTLNFITNGIGKEILVDMENMKLNNMKVKTNSIIDKVDLDKYEDYIYLGAGSDLDGIVNPKVNKYNSLNKIYKSIYNSTDEKNLDGLRDILGMTFLGKNYDYNSSSEDQLKILLSYLNDIYTGTPYSYSSELSRRSVGMFRDIITENEFKPNLNKWMIMGGLTHADGGTKDTYYGQNYHGIDVGTSDTDADMKLTGAYMLAKYGYSENLSLGVTLGGNKSEAEMSMSKVKGNSGYLGAFTENYRGNLTLKAGAGIQYSEYDADRRTLGNAYSDKYSDTAYDIYLNGRYSHNIGDNLFLEPYATLSYTYVDQDGANEGSKVLAIETDSKSFDYTVGKVGVDLKKVIPHEKGKSTLSAGVSYTKIFDGADEEYITGRFKGGSDFDTLVAHKNEHSIGLNAKYALELESGIIFDVKGTYSVERDSHNGSAKNKTKGEWIVGVGVGYKF
ncbi:autotransporter outer membrane beta-barrel domain-containing protein [Fusobacterium ulcerans]|uniref:autotransporter family protein n=1 Tax=Fusobacterium ulcerans TaxID=861 RepID=UPI000E5470C1|nr:autotransporter outer membrane beta-barrel domain-containing protein [Fusobacterium ulcerans]RGY63047.1 autotransporter outer membrane beta-barrel domain-containing protein [Fusobacterium ulcerans]